MEIGEIAAASSGDENLLADAIGVLNYGDTAPTFGGFDGAHQTGGAGAENDYIESQLIDAAEGD